LTQSGVALEELWRYPSTTLEWGIPLKKTLVVLLMFAAVCLCANAEITVGVIVGATGPGAAIGGPSKSVVPLAPTTIAGQKVRYIVYDDSTDPSNAVKNARRLVAEDHVDIIIGSSSAPTCMAVVQVAAETHTPQICFSPLSALNPWAFQVAQPFTVVMGTVADHIKASGGKTVAYIGFSDALGDTVFAGAVPNFERTGLKLVAAERYARTDSSVTGQILKIMAAKPDAVVIGASGTPAALPQLTLMERGYKGQIYHLPAVVTKDFLHLVGKNGEGAIATAGPAVVAEQLPNSNPLKKPSLEAKKNYEAMYGAGTFNQMVSTAYDAFLLFNSAVPSALKKAKPGTPEFRQALRDTLESSKEVATTSIVFNMSPTDHAGADGRSVVLVRVEKGEWKLIK
jgi:branched-chain amino acid transport system substrate-binding protein